MIIRHATIEDALEICSLCCGELEYECDPTLILAKLRSIDPAAETVYVAEIANEVVGFIYVEKRDSLFYESAAANIIAIAVDSEFRNQGVGRELIKSAERWSNNNGLSIVLLNEGTIGESAHKFYKVLDFDTGTPQLRLDKRLAAN